MESIDPGQAAEALSEIGARQRQVIDLAQIPVWYWWAVGVLMVVLAIGVDSKRPAEIGVMTSIFVLGLLATTGWIVRRVVRGAQLRNGLLDHRAALAIVATDAFIIVPTVVGASVLRAAGSHHPATIACAIAAVTLGIAGPLLMRFLRKTMLANRVGTR